MSTRRRSHAPYGTRFTEILRWTPRRAASTFAAIAAAALVGPAALAAAPRVRSPGPTAPPAADHGLYPDWLDRSVSPGVDFYRFANGGWIKAHPIPADRSYWGVDTILEQENQTFIRGLIESLGRQDWPPGSAQRKVADFYLSGMDEAGIEAAGISPLQPELARIAALDRPDQLPEEIAHLVSIGVAAPLALGQMQDFEDSRQVIAVASQSGLGLPNRDYYLKTESTFEAARSAYVGHIARMLTLLGDSHEAAALESKAVMALETRLAASSMPDIEQRNPRAIYHPMTLDGAGALAPHLEWRRLLTRLGHPEINSLNLGMPDFFAALDRELAHTPLEVWKTYLRWQLIDSYAPYLSKAFVDEDFRMTAALNGAEELQVRWLRVLRAEDEALGFAIGQLYVGQKFPPAARDAAAAIVSRIRDALYADLEALAWMTPATRAAARRKLDLMQLRIGYPDRWRDYSALVIDRGPYVLNVMRANAFEVNRQLAKIGKTVDRSEWYMTPQTVNAYYDPSMNSLNLPAGILQPPYFDAHWPDAVNYGATGATIGHEMTHGFDDEGAQFDGDGNLKDWWAPEDLVKFRRATHCISQQYSQFAVGALHVQGELVTGEAAADLGGVILAWRAWHSLSKSEASGSAGADSDFTADQQFFLAFAHSWAGAIRPKQAEQMVTTDPHPPAEDRTNASLANVPEFQRAFSIKGPGPMVKADRCVIW
jgi:putative endopeptidase